MRLTDLQTISRVFQERNGFNLINNAICIAKSGSHLYNLATPASDLDYTAVVWPPKQHIIGLGTWDKWEPKKDGLPPSELGCDLDIKVSSVRRFVQLLMKANPSLMELLWAPDEVFYRTTPDWEELRANRHLFNSKLLVKSLTGFARSQLVRMTTVDASTRDKGAKRKALIEQYGYDPKNAHHVIRLLTMAWEFIRDREFLPWRIADREYLISIKEGKWSMEDVQTTANDYLNDITWAVDTKGLLGDLPETPEQEPINDLLVSLVERRLGL